MVIEIVRVIEGFGYGLFLYGILVWWWVDGVVVVVVDYVVLIVLGEVEYGWVYGWLCVV